MSTITECNYILFGVDHTNLLGLARSLGEAGINNIFAVVLTLPTPRLVTNCKYVKKCFLVENIEIGLDFILSEFGYNDETNFIFVESDDFQSYIDANQSLIQGKFYFGGCKSQGELQQWFSKDRQNDLAKKFGLNVPRSVIANVGDIPKKMEYPVITKAVNSLVSGWKNVAHVCRSEQELKSAFLNIETKQVLIQEYVDRECETKFQSVIYNRNLLKNIPQCFDLEFLKSSYGNHHVYDKIKNPELLDAVEGMLNYIGYQGLIEVEFMRGKNGKVYFLEINFRNSGVGYYMTYCGYNLPIIYVQSVLNGKLCTDSIQKLKKLPIQTIKDYNDFIQKVRIEGMSPIKWFITRFKTAEVCLLWNKNDKLPFYVVFKDLITGMINKIIQKK